jgi:Sulfotransferase family
MVRPWVAVRPYVPPPMRAVARTVRNQVEDLRIHLWQQRTGQPRLERPVFLIGCPRSGTSICMTLFATHPWVANWSEATRVWDPGQYDDPLADHCWGRERATKQDAERLHARFEHFRQKSGKPRFVNKHPRNSVRIEYMDAIFPDAFYVNIIRDGRAVAQSIVKKISGASYRQPIPFGAFCKPPGWRAYLREDPVEQAALQWREIVRYVLDRRHLLGDRYCEVRYEDMCSYPRQVFGCLFERVGLPSSPEYLSNIPTKLENMNYKYCSGLSDAQLRTVTEVQADLLRELGYQV